MIFFATNVKEKIEVRFRVVLIGIQVPDFFLRDRNKAIAGDQLGRDLLEQLGIDVDFAEIHEIKGQLLAEHLLHLYRYI